MDNNTHAVIMIVTVAIVTFLLRAAPFIIFGKSGNPPKSIKRLGELMPSMVMAVLVIYCLKDLHFEALSGFLPAIIASIIVVALHVWKRNPLISIGFGTALYMFLIRVI